MNHFIPVCPKCWVYSGLRLPSSVPPHFSGVCFSHCRLLQTYYSRQPLPSPSLLVALLCTSISALFFHCLCCGALSETHSQGLSSCIHSTSVSWVPDPGHVHSSHCAPPASTSRNFSRLPEPWPESLTSKQQLLSSKDTATLDGRSRNDTA